ncbi:MAG: hypothetical protein AAB723_03060 [Patescibacteria group bacterium]
MPDDQNTNQNIIPEENSLPVSPQGPVADAHIPATDSIAVEMPPEAIEATRDDFEVKSNDVAPPDSIPKNTENKAKIEEIESKPETTTENQAPEIELNFEPVSEPTSKPVQASESSTAQIPVNEPFTPEPEVKPEPLKSETQPDPEILEPESEKKEIESEPVKEEIKIIEPNPTPSGIKTKPKQEEVKSIPTAIPIPVIISKNNWASELLVKARNAIQFRKIKKLDKILNLFAKRTSITNNEVEKLLHVSDATATRYLSILEKEGKIKQTGKTGHAVSYSRI